MAGLYYGGPNLFSDATRGVKLVSCSDDRVTRPGDNPAISVT
jgi:hypothetical protein